MLKRKFFTHLIGLGTLCAMSSCNWRKNIGTKGRSMSDNEKLERRVEALSLFLPLDCVEDACNKGTPQGSIQIDKEKKSIFINVDAYKNELYEAIDKLEALYPESIELLKKCEYIKNPANAVKMKELCEDLDNLCRKLESNSDEDSLNNFGEGPYVCLGYNFFKSCGEEFINAFFHPFYGLANLVFPLCWAKEKKCLHTVNSKLEVYKILTDCHQRVRQSFKTALPKIIEAIKETAGISA